MGQGGKNHEMSFVMLRQVFLKSSHGQQTESEGNSKEKDKIILPGVARSLSLNSYLNPGYNKKKSRWENCE